MENFELESLETKTKIIHDWLKENHPNKLLAKKAVRTKFKLKWVESTQIFSELATYPDAEVTHTTLMIKAQ